MTESDIPYRPVTMIRKTMNDIPQFDWPDGFSVRWHQNGDRDIWAKIVDTDIYLDADINLFVKEFGTDERVLSERMAFIVSPDGRTIGTAAAWFSDDYHGERAGRIHWVFILPEFHGQGLSKPLMTTVLNRLKDLGHTQCYLATQTSRLPAINLYLKFGFVPDIRSTNDAADWRLLKQHISHPAIRDV